jgi:hypothetical protein
VAALVRLPMTGYGLPYQAVWDEVTTRATLELLSPAYRPSNGHSGVWERFLRRPAGLRDCRTAAGRLLRRTSERLGIVADGLRQSTQGRRDRS